MDEMSEILENLPEIKFFNKCAKCGATDWSGAIMSSDNRVVLECSKCPGHGDDWSPINSPTETSAGDSPSELKHPSDADIHTQTSRADCTSSQNF